MRASQKQKKSVKYFNVKKYETLAAKSMLRKNAKYAKLNPGGFREVRINREREGER